MAVAIHPEVLHLALGKGGSVARLETCYSLYALCDNNVTSIELKLFLFVNLYACLQGLRTRLECRQALLFPFSTKLR
jgi:hypothetical protein